MAFALECDGDEFNECFDFDCPDSHPIRMPEIHLYVRVLGYEGGAHVFSNDTDVSFINFKHKFLKWIFHEITGLP